jgi:Zn-dependent M28 family amino/carboxypeptidase
MFNYIAEKRGSTQPEEIIVVGAHYDTVPGSPGADDNATGVAALLELARMLRHVDLPKTVRFVAFANEEHPGGTWESMGSYAYARSCHERKENIIAMLSLEMLGCYSSAQDSQKYPSPLNLFYPKVANFIAFVANSKSRMLVKQCVKVFRKSMKFPCEGAAAPESIKDIARSDHWAFWQFGYPGLMVTDTSNFRYQFYHQAEDTPDKLDFISFTTVVVGLSHIVCDIAGGDGFGTNGYLDDAS